MRRYDQGEFIKAIEQHSITETYMAPPLLIGIPKSPLATASAFRSLRQVWFGGAGVTHENQLPLYNLLHADARINPVWGMTEVGWVTTVSWPKKQMNSSVGKPLDGFRVR
jgi:acyl-coenzyme A synthetase/AMP-(fatty) acid ligase